MHLLEYTNYVAIDAETSARKTHYYANVAADVLTLCDFRLREPFGLQDEIFLKTNCITLSFLFIYLFPLC